MYQVIWLHDGCPMGDASIPVNTVDECKTFIRTFENKFAEELAENPKTELAIKDLTSGRLISYTL